MRLCRDGPQYVFAPHMYAFSGRIMELWSVKAKLVDGHPLTVYDGRQVRRLVHYPSRTVNANCYCSGAMDAIRQTVFESSIGTTQPSSNLSRA